MPATPWTHLEIAALRNSYPACGGSTFVRGRDRKAISGMANRLGLKYDGRHQRAKNRTPHVPAPASELEKTALRLYTSGLSIDRVAANIGKPTPWVWYHLKRIGVKFRGRKKPVSLKVDEDVTILCPYDLAFKDDFSRSLIAKAHFYGRTPDGAHIRMKLERSIFSRLLQELNGGHLAPWMEIDFGGDTGAQA